MFSTKPQTAAPVPLTAEQTKQVAGGDAAVTRQCGQNSWGENVDSKDGNPGCMFKKMGLL